MKILVGASLFIFWIFVSAVFATGFVFFQNKDDSPFSSRNSLLPSQSQSPNSDSKLSPAQNSELVLNSSEIAKHDLAKNCWILISGKVYDVTNYLSMHPGGINAILPYCGKDAAKAFTAQEHSTKANNLLSLYYIGDLNQSINASRTQQNIQNTVNMAAPLNNNEWEDEYEEEREDD